jgi:hypothetical protein
VAAEALDLLDDEPRRHRLAAAGAELYEREFSMRRTLAVLLDG